MFTLTDSQVNGLVWFSEKDRGSITEPRVPTIRSLQVRGLVNDAFCLTAAGWTELRERNLLSAKPSSKRRHGKHNRKAKKRVAPEGSRTVRRYARRGALLRNRRKSGAR